MPKLTKRAIRYVRTNGPTGVDKKTIKKASLLKMRQKYNTSQEKIALSSIEKIRYRKKEIC